MLTLKSRIDRLLAGTVTLLMAALVVDVLWQVFTRFVLRDASSYSEELARFLMIWVGLLGAAYVAGQNLHLAVDLLPESLTGRRKRRLEIVIDSCVLLFSVVVLLVGGARLVWVTLYLGQTSAALGVPLGYVYVALPVSGLLMAFYALVNIRYGPPDAGTSAAGTPDATGAPEAGASAAGTPDAAGAPEAGASAAGTPDAAGAPETRAGETTRAASGAPGETPQTARGA